MFRSTSRRQVRPPMGRREFLRLTLGSAAGLAAGAAFVRAAAAGGDRLPATESATRKTDLKTRDDGVIVAKYLTRCAVCGRLRGSVMEKYNGVLPVICACRKPRPPGPVEVKEYVRTGKPSPDLRMLSRANDVLMWSPIADYLGADGRIWHVSYLYGGLYDPPLPR